MQRPQSTVASTRIASVAKDDDADHNGPTPRLPSKTLADWTADGDDDDVNGYYAGEKRQRGGRKKRKKNKQELEFVQNWDDIYDPSRPNVFEDYKTSDEKVLEIQEWKERLYAHRNVRRPATDSDSESDTARPALNRMLLTAFKFTGLTFIQNNLRLPLNFRRCLHPDSRVPQFQDHRHHLRCCLLRQRYRTSLQE